MSVAQGDRSCQLSQSSSIHDWLDSLSDFQQISARNTRKRKSNNIVQVFAQRESDRPHKRPRYPLSEVHLDNMQNSPSMSRPQSKKHAAPDSPRNPSPTKRITPVSDVTAESAQAERGQDELAENTPRPSRRFFQLEPSRSEADTSEASSTRSQSPVKMSELNGMDGGCRLEALGNVDDVKEGHPLFRIRNLLDRFDDFSAGIGVIPAALKVLEDRSN